MPQYGGGVLKKKFVKYVVQDLTSGGVDGYLVEPRKPMQLAEKMNELIENPEMRENMQIITPIIETVN